MTSESKMPLAAIKHLAELAESEFLTSIVATATISDDGRLGDVEGIDDKVKALLDLNDWEKPSACCVATELMHKLTAAKPNIDDFAGPRLLSATNFCELVETLYTDAKRHPRVRPLQKLSRDILSDRAIGRSAVNVSPLNTGSPIADLEQDATCSMTMSVPFEVERSSGGRASSQEASTEQPQPASYLRRRIRLVPSPGAELQQLLTQITNLRSNTIGLGNLMSQIDEKDVGDFGRCIAKAITAELLGDTGEMLLILNKGKFDGINEQVRRLYRGIAYEKLWKRNARNIDLAIADYAFILSKPCWGHCNNSEDYRQLVLAASFNVNICFEKNGLFDHVDFESFLNNAEGNARIAHGDKLWHKAIGMQMITRMRIGTDQPTRHERSLLTKALAEQLPSDPAGWVKTLLTKHQITGERLTPTIIDGLFTSGQVELPVHAKAAVLAELVRHLLMTEGDQSLLSEVVALLEEHVNENPDPTVGQYLETVHKWLNKPNAPQ